MKRCLALLLSLSLLCGTAALAAEPQGTAPWTRTEPGGNYVTIRVPYPEGRELSWSDTQKLCVRYADTGEAVPLTSEYFWDGCLFATVPASEADRPLEVFQGEVFHFYDTITVWQGHEYYEAPVGTDGLYIRGILQGDGAGNLNADQVLTRAEAFALILRLLSIPEDGALWTDWYYANGESTGYEDVAPAAWYFPVAAAALNYGLASPGTYFYPERPVTRAEFVVMLTRAMKSVGWIAEDAEAGLTAEETLNYPDAAEIPDWALDSYLAIQSYPTSPAPPLTWVETGGGDGVPTYDVLLEPEKPTTRGEVIETIASTLRYLTYYPTQKAIDLGFDREMPIIDGSTSTYPYTTAVFASLFGNYTNQPQFPRGHSKSYYSYERLINGEADILFISTKPTEDTLRKAEEAGVELELIPIAYDAMVFFTNGANPVKGLTSEQIRNVYVDNQYTNWNELGGPDAGFIPYCRNMDSGSQAQMEEFFLHGADIHPDIKRETTSVSMSSVLTDVEGAMTTDPPAYALGYSIFYYYHAASQIILSSDGALKLLEVDGVYPTDETIADGSYPLSGYNYAVVRADEPEGSPARRMVEYMLSEEGQDCVVNAGFGPLNPAG